MIHLLNLDSWGSDFWIRWVTRLQECTVKNFRGYSRSNQNKYDHKYRHKIRTQLCSHLGSFVINLLNLDSWGSEFWIFVMVGYKITR